MRIKRQPSCIAVWNSRHDELQTAILRVKLRHLGADNAARVCLAVAYEAQLRDTSLALPRRRAECSHVFHLNVARCPQRDALQWRLKQQGIGALVHFPAPIHLQAAYQGRVCTEGALLETEKAAREILSLPMYPELTETQQSVVGQVAREFYESQP